MYSIIFSSAAKKDLKLLARKAPEAIPKLSKLLSELMEHPSTGTGRVERLKCQYGQVYSRRLTREHRLVYRIYEDIVEVLVLSAFGHYR